MVIDIMENQSELDSCVKCGSGNIKPTERNFEVDLTNPGKVKVSQSCSECQECHETYFDENQSLEFARKLDAEKRKEKKWLR